MSTSALISVDDYLRMTEKPHREYRDGVLYPKPMATSSHGVLQFMLALLLHKLGLHVGTEVTLRISENKYLIPDVIAAARPLGTPYPTEPVLLCCEILSPEDRLGQMLAKCEEYHAWGVPFCWVIDPEKRAAWEYHRGGEPVHVAETLRAGDIALSIPELFSVLSK